MRRGVALLLSLSALGWLTPSLFGQYPYPYAPPAYRPAPMPYGYYPQAQMPYGYNPQGQMPYGYYPPASGQRVYVYGPLEDPQPAPAPTQPQPAPAKLPDAVKTAKPATTPAKSGVTPVQATTSPVVKDAAPVTRSSWWPLQPAAPAHGACGPQGCGDGCGDGSCDTGCATCIPRDPPRLGHGQLIAEFGANVLVPYPSPRQAFNTTSGGVTSTNDFPHQVDVSPFASLGYLFHTGWGIRGDYSYLNGSQNQSTGNSALTTVIGIPLGTNFQFTSPSPTLKAGIGGDTYSFAQTLTLNVADLEVLRQLQFMDTTFLFGSGARYGRISQTYAATQSNPGGANGVITVTLDQQDANASNVFEGWGPTVSMEVIHAIPRSCFSMYGNVRGSFLWGTDTFSQSLRTQNNSVVVAGAITRVDTTNITTVVNHREASIGEAEVGLQYGSRCGPCFVFVRAGASFQRWWDVGSPTTANGNLSFLGGVARVGVSY
jgi:hypothetical protein